MNKFYRIVLVALSLILMTSLIGCGKKEKVSESQEDSANEIEQGLEAEPEIPETEVLSDLNAEITWWTYPIFVQESGAAAGDYERQLVEEFQKYYPNIQVNVELLDYENGPAQVETAITENLVPDVLFDGPARIQEYAKKGVLTDLSDIFGETEKADLVSAELLSACQNEESLVMYPFSMVNYVMAFNKEMLETSGAIELMDREGARIWTTENFVQVLERLNYSGFKAGSLYCSGVAGDYGTRSFLTNLYNVSLMNEEQSSYAFQGEAAENTLAKVKEWIDASWILNGSGETGAQSIEDFVSGNSSFTLLWSLPQAISNAAALEQNGIEVVEMPYPAENGMPALEYILNGFCVFDSGDETRMEASKYLIDFICNGEQAAEHVVRTGAFPVRQSLGDVYQGNETALFYEALRPYSGTYYQKVQGFEQMRVYWYQMISEVINGEYGPAAAANSFVEYTNETLTQKQEGDS